MQQKFGCSVVPVSLKVSVCDMKARGDSRNISYTTAERIPQSLCVQRRAYTLQVMSMLSLRCTKLARYGRNSLHSCAI